MPAKIAILPVVTAHPLVAVAADSKTIPHLLDAESFAEILSSILEKIVILLP